MGLLAIVEKRLFPWVLLALPVAAPLVATSNRDLSLMGTAATYAILVIALNFVFGYGGILSAAHAALWGAGAFAAAYANLHWGWGYWVTLPFAAAVATLAAVAIGLPSFRTSGTQFLIITFAFGEFLHLAERNLKSITGGLNGVVVVDQPPSIGPIDFGFGNLREHYYLALFMAYACILVVWWIRHSDLGAKLIAIRDNEQLAMSVGIDVFRVKLMAFAISGAIAGVAGNVYLYQKAAINPDLFGSLSGLQFISAMIAGGVGTIAGPAAGVTFIVFLPEFLHLDPQESRAAYGAVLILFILLLPRGIIGTLAMWYQRAKQKLLGGTDSKVGGNGVMEPRGVRGAIDAEGPPA